MISVEELELSHSYTVSEDRPNTITENHMQVHADGTYTLPKTFQVQENAQHTGFWTGERPGTPPMSEASPIGPREMPIELPDDTCCKAKAALKILEQPWSEDSEKCVNIPYTYLLSHPGKDIRTKLISSVNVWLKVDPATLKVIGDVVSMLHNASLLVDDIEDDSVLRRGAPAAHHIHGIPLTINSGNYVYFQAQQKLFDLPNALEMVRIYNEELLNLHRGQGMDIYWRETVTVPTEADYLIMVSNKTGGLFRLAIRMMMAVSPTSVDLIELTNVLGLLFQIQDDYKNLTSAKMSATKGFCEDLSEGKMSYPIIHAIHNSSEAVANNIINILRSRTENVQVKMYVVSQLKNVTRSLQYTVDMIDRLQERAAELLKGLGPNESMKKILSMLVATDDATELENGSKRNASQAGLTDEQHFPGVSELTQHGVV